METLAYEVQESLDMDEEKWFGVPPVGERKTPSRWRYLIEITLVLLLEFFLWGIYRVTTAPIYGEGFNIPFFIGHMIAAPTIMLGPILLYWKFIRKERLFYKDDYENGRFLSFNFGPFKLTRKRLFTAVLVGLFGGVMWRITEMLISNFSSVILGGTEFMTLKWMDIFTVYGSDYVTFFLMTFVMFFIVGPVEEFQFRAFTQDQSQRVLPKWAALTFSSIFFGFSHLPIAIFIYMPNYHWTIADLILAEIGWMTAGATFGALYMWSRNIVATIVMHGIGNWQLSVFLLQGRSTIGGLSDSQGLIAQFIVAIVTNAIMIYIFYLIHKYYWQPQRNGEAAFGGRMLGIQKYLFSHDNGMKRTGYTGGSLAAITAVVLIVLFSISGLFGVKDLSAIAPSAGKEEAPLFDLTTYSTTTSSNLTSDYLNQGDSMEIDLGSNTGQIIKRVNAKLTWTDETQKPGRPTIRRYTNQPDTFNLTMTGPNSSVQDTQANPVEGQGSINIELEISENTIMETHGNYNLTVVVTMTDAGMWSGRALLGWNDPGNAFDLMLQITYLENPNLIPEGETSSGGETGNTSLAQYLII